MPLKNYTTRVPASQSIRETETALIRAGAIGTSYEYERGTSRIEALAFRLEVKGNHWNFALPVNWKLFQVVLKEQGIRDWNDEDYVYRVAWRNIRDWVLAQMALYETALVELPQVFLPFVMNRQGKTLYEAVKVDPSRLLTDGLETR